MTDLVGDSAGVVFLGSTLPAEDLLALETEVFAGAVIGLDWVAGDFVVVLFEIDVLGGFGLEDSERSYKIIFISMLVTHETRRFRVSTFISLRRM